MTRAKWKGYAALLAVFLLGGAAGGGLVFWRVQKHHAAMLNDGRALQTRRLNVLTKKLDLDPDQQTKIGAILDKDREESIALNDDMMEKCGQPLRDHKADVAAQIKAVLRPDQQARFDKLVEDRKRGRGRGPR